MTEDVKLEPCPFCQSDNHYVACGSSLYWGKCVACGAEGPTKDGRAEAVAAWNTRAPDPRITTLLARVQELEEGLKELLDRYIGKQHAASQEGYCDIIDELVPVKAARALLQSKEGGDAEQRLELLEAVFDAAMGLSYGEDWENGTHAKLHGYRRKLLTALGRAAHALGRKSSPQAECAYLASMKDPKP